MPLHPYIQARLDAEKAMNLPPAHTLPVGAVRAGIAQMIAGLEANLSLPPIAGVENRTIPGPAGALPVRIYTPEGTGPFPVLVFFHGGGFAICSLDTHDGQCRLLCAGSGCVVVSVDYRLAPEHKFPSAPDDCYSATKWVAQHTTEINGDPARLAIGGDSAGGNLAAVVALRVRDEGGPALRGQLLIYPVTDLHGTMTDSYRENGEGYGLDRSIMEWFHDAYLNSPADEDNPHASPYCASSQRDLPPALVITAQYDPLRDEGEAYGKRLQESGVPITITRYDGVNHGFFAMSANVEQARQAIDQACAWLKDVLKA